MRIYFTTIDSQIFQEFVDENALIRDVLRDMHNKPSFPFEEIYYTNKRYIDEEYLMYNGEKLDFDRTLNSYDITTDSIVVYSVSRTWVDL